MKLSSTRTAAIGLVITAVGLTGCAASGGDDDTASSIVIASPTDVTYDPLNGGAQYYANPAVQAVYDTLLIWDQTDDTFDPWLASGYTLSDDKRVLTITLRDDVTFIDGAKLNAEGMVKMLNLVRDTPTQSVSFVNLGEAGYGAEFEVVDEYTFEFRTTKKAIDHAIFQVLDTMQVPSPDALDDPESLSTTPVGSGPYILDEENSTPGVELTYTRNPDYWNPDVYPYDTLTIKSFDDNVAALNALKSGQIDATAIDIGSAAEAEAAGFAITVGLGSFRTLFFGDRAGDIVPALADLRVRRAINMAFDRDAINEAIDFGRGAASSQVFVEGQLPYLEGRDDEYPYDPERAKELLAEAGYPDGFEITIPTLAPYTTDMEPVVQQSLSDIGITVTYVSYADAGAFLGGYATHPVLMFPESNVNQITNYAPGGLFSGYGYFDEDLLDLVETMYTADAAEAKEAGQQIGEFLLEEAWFAPFGRVPSAWASIPEVSITLDLTASIRLQLFKPTE